MLTFEYELCNYLNPIKNNKQWRFVLSMIKVYVVVQYILGSILCVVTYENECKTKKKTNWKEDKIEPQQILSIST